jgi:hypothetical protein
LMDCIILSIKHREIGCGTACCDLAEKCHDDE